MEAAVRAGRRDVASEAFTLYQRWARHAGQPWIDAVLQRRQALIGADESAEESYTAALSAYRCINRPFDEARTALLYGEWLRRARRQAEARTHLSAALDGFEKQHAVPWAARARAELSATGGPAARPPPRGAPPPTPP